MRINKINKIFNKYSFFICLFIFSVLVAGCTTQPIIDPFEYNPNQKISTIKFDGVDSYDTYDISRGQKKIGPKEAVQLLNHVSFIVAKIKNENTILEDEYNQIRASNLDLNCFSNDDIRDCFKKLDTAITNAIKERGDKELLEYVKEKQLKNALFSSAPSTAAVVSKDWQAMVFSISTSCLSWFMNYRALKEEINLEFKKDLWELDKDHLENISRMYQDLFDSQVKIIREYDINALLCTSENDFKVLLEYTYQTEAQLYEYLVLNEDKFRLSTVYWFYRGKTARKLNKKVEALKCFKTFQNLHCEFLRHDEMATLVAQGIIEILCDNPKENKREIKNQLEKMEKYNSEEKWEFNFFQAVVYSNVFKKYDVAEERIRQAINKLELKYDDTSIKYLEDLYKEKKIKFGKKWKKGPEIPSAETLLQCRLFLFNLKSNQESLKSYYDDKWDKYYYSNFERICFLSYYTPSNINKEIKGYKDSNTTTLFDEINGVFIDDYELDGKKFDLYLPIKWACVMPEKIQLSLYNEEGKCIYTGKEVASRRMALIYKDDQPYFKTRIETKSLKKPQIEMVKRASLDFDHPKFLVKMFLEEKKHKPKSPNKIIVKEVAKSNNNSCLTTYKFVDIKQMNEVNDAIMRPSKLFFENKDTSKCFIIEF